jgi:hypothetical protein
MTSDAVTIGARSPGSSNDLTGDELRAITAVAD